MKITEKNKNYIQLHEVEFGEVFRFQSEYYILVKGTEEICRKTNYSHFYRDLVDEEVGYFTNLQTGVLDFAEWDTMVELVNYNLIVEN